MASDPRISLFDEGVPWMVGSPISTVARLHVRNRIESHTCNASTCMQSHAPVLHAFILRGLIVQLLLINRNI